MEWMTLASLLIQAVILPIVTGVYRQLRELNGRMTRIEEWRMLHDKQDDERHREVTEGQRELWRAVEVERRR